jgi:hypothetical protein
MSDIISVYAAIFKAWQIMGGHDDVHPEHIVSQVRLIECSPEDLGGLLLLRDFDASAVRFDFRENASLPAGTVIVEFK